MSASRGIAPESAETAAHHAIDQMVPLIARLALDAAPFRRDYCRYFVENAQTVAEAVKVATYGPGDPPDWLPRVTERMSAAWDLLGRALRGEGA